MRIQGGSHRVYAAKRFYNIGDPDSVNAVSYEDNLAHLKEEAIRQNWAKHSIEKFQTECIKKAISVFSECAICTSRIMLIELCNQGLHVETPYILEVVKSKSGFGGEDGLAWLVDPLLDHTATRKFSGTAEAGSNNDFAGKTCDALAHFSLHDSSGEAIMVDIQGKYLPISF